ncbi:MAG: hypothetical protein U9N85_04380 [Bacteroidota bacterium]|nr:hypothetical protein [Bacteroidota bacterium]
MKFKYLTLNAFIFTAIFLFVFDNTNAQTKQITAQQLKTLRTNIDHGNKLGDSGKGEGNIQKIFDQKGLHGKMEDNEIKAFQLMYVTRYLTEDGIPDGAKSVDDIYSLDSKLDNNTVERRGYLHLITGDISYLDPNKTIDEFINSEFYRKTRESIEWAMNNNLTGIEYVEDPDAKKAMKDSDKGVNYNYGGS